MPNNGRLIQWAVLEYRLSGSATGSPNPTKYATLNTYFTPDSVDVASGIQLTISMGADIFGNYTWYVLYNGPNQPFGGYRVSGTGFSDPLTVSVQFTNVRIYGNGGTWNFFCDDIQIFVNDVFNHSLGSYSTLSGGLGPSYIPIIGVPAYVQGNVGNAYSDPTGDHIDFTASASGYIEGGFRFKEGAGDPWQTLPGTVPPISQASGTQYITGIVMPTVGSLAHIPVYTYYHISLDRTWWVVNVSVKTLDRIRSSDGYNSVVFCLPDLTRSILRMNTNYRGFWFRNGFPQTIGSSQYRLTNPNGGPFGQIIKQVFLNPLIHKRYTQFLAVVGDAQHVIEEPLTQHAYTPLTATSSGYYYEEHYKLDASGNLLPGTTSLFRVENSSIQFPNTVDDAAANPQMVDDQYHADKTIRYMNYWGNPHWHYHQWRENWSGYSYEDYWSAIREKWLYNSKLPANEQRKTRCWNASGFDWLWSPWSDYFDAFVGGMDWIGIHRWQLRQQTLPTSLTLDSTRHGEWAAPSSDATLTFGSDITVTAI